MSYENGRGMRYLEENPFKKVQFIRDEPTGLRAIIAIHSTVLGPANGGLRIRPYETFDEALYDVLRLARGMTYKWAAAGQNRGGGKAVIIADPRTEKTEQLLRAFGKYLNALHGEYYTGADMGSNLDDMEVIYQEADYVATLPTTVGGVGDISHATAFGSIQAMKACVKRVWGSPELRGKKVAMQGLGACGSEALRLLLEEGATPLVSDVDEDRLKPWRQDSRVRIVDPESVHAQEVDIFAPYAIGGVINDRTIDELKARVVVGSANNIFAEDRHARELESRGITYAVDYIANAGGAILDADQFRKGGFVRERAMKSVASIFDRIELVFERAEQGGITYLQAAAAIAEERIEAMRNLNQV